MNRLKLFFSVIPLLVAGFACTVSEPGGESAREVRIPSWKHLSTANGDLPELGPSDQQTGSHVADLDKDGIDDFVITARVTGPSVTWYRRTADGWDKYIIDDEFLSIEAGGASHDIDGDGDLDLVCGGDSRSNQMWWWENPYPDYDPGKNWTRRLIKDSGGNKHHDQAFGDVDADGEAELVSWNQGGRALLVFEIPEDPRESGPWPSDTIFEWPEGEECEGIAVADVNQDGNLDIVGGGRWFDHTGDGTFAPHVIDDQYGFSRAAAAQIVDGGWLEVVFQPGDLDGPLTWFEWDGNAWVAHQLVEKVIHGHSLAVGDINGDGHQDLFSAEMGQWGRKPTVNPAPKVRIFYGDGAGGFTPTVPIEGFGNHESRIADLDGDGDLDILGKPYNWRAPRVDVWLQEAPRVGALDRWRRHVIDYEKPWRAIYIGAGDLDGDGRNDLVTGGWWYRNPGSLDENWPRADLGSPLNNMAAIADFDGDGDLDVLGTGGQGSAANPNFVWARNDGGQFTIHDNVATADGDFLQGVAVGRFQDNKLEVALSWHTAGRGIQMLTVPADPINTIWGWRRVQEQSLDEELSEGDIDGDGDLDILMGTQWLENTGTDWALHTLHEPTGMPDRNCLVDINGDGKLDSVAGFESSRAPGKLAWYQQGADPKAAWAEHEIDLLIGPMSMDCADMDGDGDVDVVLGQHNLKDPPSSRLIVFENADGSGGAWNQHVVWTGDEHHDGSQTVDMDGDGDLDIISIGWTHGRVIIYENLGAE